MNGINEARLKQILEAEADGRLVILPCKVGDALYFKSTYGEEIVESKVRSFWMGVVAYCKIPRLLMVRTTRCDIEADNFGKTVFLSREEAEKCSPGTT